MDSSKKLTIQIVADASDAKSALLEVGKQSADTKTKFDDLTKSTQTTEKALKDLVDTANNLKIFKSGDTFGLLDAERRLSKINTSTKGIKRNLESFGTFAKQLSSAEKILNDIKASAEKGSLAFTLDPKTASFLTDINKTLDRVIAQQNSRWKLLNEERNLLNAQSALLRRQRGLTTQNVKDQRKLLTIENERLKRLTDTQKAMKVVDVDAKKSRSDYEHMGMGAMMADGMRYFGMDFYDRLSHLQEKQARVDAWGLSDKDRATWKRQVNDLLKVNKFITRADAEAMMMAASSSIGHYDPNIVGKTVADATKYAQMERAMGYNKSEIDDIAKNYYGVAEARQVANDIEKTLETFKTVFRITTTTSGKITVADVETILRNMGPGASTISDEGLLRLLAYAEQIKIAGRGASGSTGAGISTVGTNVKMLQLMAMGKPSSINAKKQMAELGIMEDQTYIKLSDGSYGLNFNAKEGAQKKESEFARGLLGQIVLDDVAVNPKKPGMAGIYNKELAQKDPVAWVTSMTKLIHQFTVESENRRAYYGALADGRMGLSDDAFLNRLTEEQLYSATQTFWAKTGLSQRVLTALTTFSNEAFQHRSAAMMQTAMHQTDVDSLMKMQIDNGNLNLSFLALEKSASRLAETFNPLAKEVAKLVYSFSNFVDFITRWSAEWNSVSSVLLTSMTLKGAMSMGGQFLSRYGMRNGNSGDNKNNNTEVSIIPFTKTNGKVDKTLKDTKEKFNRFFSFVSKGLSVMINGAVVGSVVASFGTMLLEMTAEYTDWGKNLKKYFIDLFDEISKSKIFVDIVYGEGSGLNKEEKTQFAKNKKELEQIKDEMATIHAKDELSLNDHDRMAVLKMRKNAIEKENSEFQNKSDNLKAQISQTTTDYETVAKNIGLIEKVREYEQLRADFDAKSEAFKVVENNYKNSAKTKEDKAVYLKAYNEYTESFNRLSKSREELERLANNPRILELITKIRELVDATGGMAISDWAVDTTFASFRKVLGSIFALNEKDTKLTLDQGYGSNIKAGSVNGGNAVMATQDVDKYVKTTRHASQTLDVENAKLTNVKTIDSRDKINVMLERLVSDRNKLTRRSNFRGQFDSMADQMSVQEEAFRAELATGKYKKDGKYPFLPNSKHHTEDGMLNGKDFDLRMTYNGVTGYEIVRQKALNEQLRKFNENFRTTFRSAEDAVRNTNVELEEAMAGITEVGEAMAENKSIATLKSDLVQLQQQFEASGVADYRREEINTILGLKRQELYNVAGTALAERMKSNLSAIEQSKVAGLTNKGQKSFEYHRQNAVLTAQHNASIKTFEEMRDLAMIGKNEEERQQILKDSNEKIEQAEALFQENMVEREKRFQEELKGERKKGIDQKVEEWTSVDANLKNIQEQMMEGFVTANENWLDGDKDSWRDYCNDILMMWRNMVLKMGSAELLKMATDGIMDFAGNFLNAAFGNQSGESYNQNSLGAWAGSFFNLGGLMTGGTTNTSIGIGQSLANAGAQTMLTSANGFQMPVMNDGIGLTNSLMQPSSYGMFGSSLDGMDALTGQLDQASESFGLLTSGTDALTQTNVLADTARVSLTASESMGEIVNQASQSAETAATTQLSALAIAAEGAALALQQIASQGAADGVKSIAGGIAGAVTASANGNIMTKFGPLKLQKYANGGIARSAQVSIFGEGSKPEAYVPLPDGRSIPVTLNGGMGMGGSNVGGNNINISINVTNNEGSTTESQSTSDTTKKASDMNKLANNIKSIVKQEIANQSRPGGLLYNGR